MAEAKRAAITAPAGEVALTLSDDEADVLFCILHLVGGSDTDSPRMHADAILEALRCGAELEFSSPGIQGLRDMASGGIDFDAWGA